MTLSRASFRDDPVGGSDQCGTPQCRMGTVTITGASLTRGAARKPRSVRCGAVHPRVGHQSWAHHDPQWDVVFLNVPFMWDC